MSHKRLGVEQGRACIIDNELHEETLSNRIAEMTIDIGYKEPIRQIDRLNLRGQEIDVNGLESIDIASREYTVVVIDALYKMLPDGISENDNGGMMRVYNRLDALAKKWDTAIVVIHHSSKGRQSEKSLTDIGAGAGSISRAADTHVAIRPHRQEGLFVLEACTRSYPTPNARTIRFEYPIWSHVDKIEPHLQTVSR